MALPPAEQALRISNHCLATYYAHRGGVGSLRGTREWLAAWRHFLDEIEVKRIATPELVQFVQRFLDLAEQVLRDEEKT